MKFKKLILSLLITNVCIFNVHSASVNNEEITKKTVAEKNTRDINDTLDSDYLAQYYKEKSGNGRVQIDYQYLLDKPLDMDEVVDLKHPYFNKQLSNMTDEDIDGIINNVMQDEFKGLRNNAIFDEAFKYGIQSSLYKVLTDFSIKLEKIAPYYSKNFNFAPFMLYNGRVKPPVLVVTTASLEKESKFMLRKTDKALTFYKQAEVTIDIPTFRDYLTFTPIRPEQPNILLLPLPKKPEELIIWQKGASAGWIQGLRQAYIVINEGLVSLVRDFTGMDYYTNMLKSNFVTMPIVTKSDLSTHTNGTTMNIGESTFVISELPKFNTDSQSWVPLPQVESIFEDFYLTEKDLEDLGELRYELELDYNL